MIATGLKALGGAAARPVPAEIPVLATVQRPSVSDPIRWLVVVVVLLVCSTGCGSAKAVQFKEKCEKEMGDPVFGIAEADLAGVCTDLYEVEQLSPSKFGNYDLCVGIVIERGEPFADAVKNCLRIAQQI